jgi:prepilin-type N-terminal cleavage/methylation domain-containing protein
MPSKNTRALPDRRRGGFTLIEVMIVIAIIALLLSLSAGTYLLVMRTQRVKNTEMLIEKLNTALQAQKKAYQDQVKQGTIPDAYMNAAGGDRTLAAALYLNNQALPYEFPTTFADAWAHPTYRRMLQEAGYTSAPAATASQSSACLLMALRVGRGGAVFDPASLESGVVIDLDGDSIKELRDAWGDPLQFRWQTGAPLIWSNNM